MRSMRRRLRALSGERGAALVEFALVLPFLMTILCATIDFGLCMYTLNNLTAAVREGGRFAAVQSPAPTANNAAVIDRVYNYIAALPSGQTAAQIKATISNTVPDPTTGNITVKITGYQYKAVTPIAALFGMSTITLNRTAIFRWELSS